MLLSSYISLHLKTGITFSCSSRTITWRAHDDINETGCNNFLPLLATQLLFRLSGNRTCTGWHHLKLSHISSPVHGLVEQIFGHSLNQNYLTQRRRVFTSWSINVPSSSPPLQVLIPANIVFPPECLWHSSSTPSNWYLRRSTNGSHDVVDPRDDHSLKLNL